MDLDHFTLDSCPEQQAIEALPSPGSVAGFGTSPSSDEVVKSNGIAERSPPINTKLTKKLIDHFIPYQDEEDYFFDPIFQYHSCSETSAHRKNCKESGKNKLKSSSITLDYSDLSDWSSNQSSIPHANYAFDTNTPLFIDTSFGDNNFNYYSSHILSCSGLIESFDSSMENLDPMATLYAFNASSGNNNSPLPSNNSTPPLPEPVNSSSIFLPPQPATNSVHQTTNSSSNPSNHLPSHSRSHDASVREIAIHSDLPQSPGSRCSTTDATQSHSSGSATPVTRNLGYGAENFHEVGPYQTANYYHLYDHYPGNGHYHQYHSHQPLTYHDHISPCSWPTSPQTGAPPQPMVEARIVNHCSTPVSPHQSSTIQIPTANGSMSVNLSMNMSFTASSTASTSPQSGVPVVDHRSNHTTLPTPSQPQHHQQILWTAAAPPTGYSTEYTYSGAPGFVHSPTGRSYHSDIHQNFQPRNSGQVYHQLSSRGNAEKQPEATYSKVLLPPIEKEFANISTFHRHHSSPSTTSVDTVPTNGSNSSESPPSLGPVAQRRYQERSYHYMSARGCHQSVQLSPPNTNGSHRAGNRRTTTSSYFSRSSDMENSPPETFTRNSNGTPSSTFLQVTEGAGNNLASHAFRAVYRRQESLAPNSGKSTAISEHHLGEGSGINENNEKVVVGRPGGHLVGRTQIDCEMTGKSRREKRNELYQEKEDDEEAQEDPRDIGVGIDEQRSPGNQLFDHHHIMSGSPAVSLPENGVMSTGSNMCMICGKSYARPSTLKTHLRTHSGERPYRCPMCCKSFSQAANLTAHLRTHSGEKPFTCNVCGRRFSQSSSVTTHMRTHSGERPYHCSMCRKAFSDSSTLTKHLRIHSGEKPYQCKLCHLKFSQSGNLNRHMRIHTTGQI